MKIKASGRSAVTIATGIWVCFAAPLHATETADGATETTATAGAPVALSKFTKHRSEKPRKHVSKGVEKSTTTASKISESKKPADAEASKDDGAPPTITPAVADANAQMSAGDTLADKAVKTMSAQADNVLLAAKQGGVTDLQPSTPPATPDVVSEDQLNDVDRALSENKVDQAAPSLALASIEAPAQAAAAQTPAATMSPAVSNDDSTWGQTSLIGKIFIAFGGLLTLASAARMFIA